VHSKGKPFSADIDFLALAKRTVGMSGADLANVINEAALLTARENGTVITNFALEEAVDRVIGGPARKGKVISEQEKKITAYHEGGHALAAWAMPGLEPVYKVTILPRGRTGGHALVVPEDDKSLMTRSEMIARLVMALGGRAAEELVFAEPTTGASSDIATATKIARAMVTEYGMSGKLGAVKYGHGEDEPFLGRTYGSGPEYSIEVGSEIDHEVRALIEAAHTEAWEVLNTYRDVLDALAAALLEKETLERKDLQVIFAEVEKRPRITTFDQFGVRAPSDRPPIKTPRELALERGEPWPPEPDMPEPAEEPLPIGALQGPPGQSGYNSEDPAHGGAARGAHAADAAPPPAPGPLPPDWTGGVLPGPLGPPAWNQPGTPSQAKPGGNGQAGPPPAAWRGGAQPGGGSGFGPAGSGNGQAQHEDADRPTDPWAPPGDGRR
jgi:cell division protease FtsH